MCHYSNMKTTILSEEETQQTIQKKKRVFVPFLSLTSLSLLPVRPHPLLQGDFSRRFQDLWGDRPGLLQQDKIQKSGRGSRRSGETLGCLCSGTFLSSAAHTCQDWPLGSSPPLSKWFTMWGGGRSYCQETFFPTWFKHTQEKRGGVLRCGLQAGECKSVGSPTPAGRTGAALPAVHLPEGLSNQSPFKIRFHDHRSTVGNTCPNRKKSLLPRISKHKLAERENIPLLDRSSISVYIQYVLIN